MGLTGEVKDVEWGEVRQGESTERGEAGSGWDIPHG